MSILLSEACRSLVTTAPLLAWDSDWSKVVNMAIPSILIVEVRIQASRRGEGNDLSHYPAYECRALDDNPVHVKTGVSC